MLSSDISRCTNKDCKLSCRRKEPSNSDWQVYSLFKEGKVKQCEYQIEYEN